MAQRIGKYKISKRESEMSIVDGGEISGPTVLLTGLAAGTTVVSSSLASNQLFRTASGFVTSSQTTAAVNVSAKLFDILCITK